MALAVASPIPACLSEWPPQSRYSECRARQFPLPLIAEIPAAVQLSEGGLLQGAGRDAAADAGSKHGKRSHAGACGNWRKAGAIGPLALPPPALELGTGALQPRAATQRQWRVAAAPIGICLRHAQVRQISRASAIGALTDHAC